MAPVVKGIANQLRHGLSPGLEFLTVSAVAGYIFFINTVGAHLTPLIMVAAQPYLGDVFELAVLVNLLGINVAVVVYDGHVLRILMV